MEQATAEAVERTLFEPWDYRDEGLSMRWDPVEDRRYALMEADPGPMGARTMWMANLLAYRGLAMFPAAPTRSGLSVTGWAWAEGEPAFTWPVWEGAVGPEAVRSLLQQRELGAPMMDAATLQARGVAAVFRARRVRVGSGANFKLNFSPARAVWMGGAPGYRGHR